MERHQSFSYRGSKLLVDAAIIVRWGNVPDAEKLRIWQSVRLVYTAWLSEIEAAKFFPTREGIRAQLTLEILPTDKLPKIAAKLDDKSVKKEVLELLKFTRFRPFNRSPLRNLFCRAINHAAIDGDEVFFRRLGRVLEREPVPFPPVSEPTPIEVALVNDWMTDDGFCLCWCSDQAIADLLTTTKIYVCTFDAVRKARQRLRLRKPKRTFVTSVRRTDRVIVLS